MATKTTTSDRTPYLYRVKVGETSFGGATYSRRKAISRCRQATLKFGDQAKGRVSLAGRDIYRCTAGLNKVGRLTLTEEPIE